MNTASPITPLPQRALAACWALVLAVAVFLAVAVEVVLDLPAQDRDRVASLSWTPSTPASR